MKRSLILLAIISFLACSDHSSMPGSIASTVEGTYLLREHDCFTQPVSNVRVYQNDNNYDEIKIDTEAGRLNGQFLDQEKFEAILDYLKTPSSKENCSGEFDNEFLLMRCEKTICNGSDEECKSETCNMEYELCANCNNDLEYPN